MIQRTPPSIGSDQRREFLALWAWLPFGPDERMEIAAEVLDIPAEILGVIVEQDPTLKSDMEQASRAATDAVFQRLRELAEAGDRDAAVALRHYEPIYRRNPA